jgi:hypothetical protein
MKTDVSLLSKANAIDMPGLTKLISDYKDNVVKLL